MVMVRRPRQGRRTIVDSAPGQRRPRSPPSRPRGEVIFGVFHVDRARAAASFRRLAALDAELACFGHGEPALTGAGDRLRVAAGLVEG
jgi:hypothetical protein